MPALVQIQGLNSQSIQFSLPSTPLYLANCIRRVFISEIPTMAIDFVTFYENTSPLNDEYLAHRFGLIPLTSQLVGRFNFPSECACMDGSTVCSVCSVKYTLKVKNDTN